MLHLHFLDIKKNDWIKNTLKGFKLLRLASQIDSVGVVSYIIEHYPERLNYQDVYGKSCLFYAVEQEQWNTVKYLISKNINYYMADKNGNSLLHILAKIKAKKEYEVIYFELVQKLISHRRIVRGKNILGETPLHIACLNSHKKLIQLLIDNKSLIHCKTEKGLTPWDYCQFSDKICIDLSTMNDPDDGTPNSVSPFSNESFSDSEQSGGNKLSKGQEMLSPRYVSIKKGHETPLETKNTKEIKEIKPNRSQSILHLKSKSDIPPEVETSTTLNLKEEHKSKNTTPREEQTTEQNGNQNQENNEKDAISKTDYKKYKKYNIDEEKYKKFEALATKFAGYLNPPKPLPPKAPYQKGDKFRILSLDGGGIKCIYQCAILQRILDKFPDFFEKIDVITGVSASSVPCVAIALGYDLLSVEKMMEDMLCETFSRIINKGGIVGHQYSNKFLFVMGDKVFGDLTMDKLTRKVCIPSYLTDTGKDDPNRTSLAKFYNNFLGEEVPYSLTEVCIQSAAAPGYFGSVNAHLDGGVIINEPCGGVLSYVIGEYGLNVDIKDISVLSIGAGYPAIPYIPEEELREAGPVKWTLHMPDLQIESRKSFIEFEGKYLLGDRFFRLNPKLPYQIDLDYCKDVELIKSMGDNLDLTETFKWIEQNW
ncbi:phospholipase, patatin family protein [Entamoeba histolytica HM-3:IMSS]|uniref:phospholipase A2 n=3 Tax=Entamoeba histolytica TaxID=5759 RepID=M2RXI8_ENTHI|nr:phospholipase patatin family protein [Entamoeba histolytica KU27]EMS12097.1 phospholipase, patatin family protein [Entamoeba histolytica HM-3:IMSS]